MIKAEVIFDDDDIYYNERMIRMIQGVNCDYWVVEDIAETFKTMELAIKYCLENLP